MRKYIIIIFLLITCLNYSCFDIFKSEEINIVGNIALINPKVQDGDSFRLIYFEEKFNKNLINENIIKLYGNDSVLLVISSILENKHKFYKVLHKNGYNPIKVLNIDSIEFINNAYSINAKYLFPK